MLRLFLQPQKKGRQATPKKTQDVKVEDDEYAGSTDVDEPGLYELPVTGGEKKLEEVVLNTYFWEIITRFAFRKTLEKNVSGQQGHGCLLWCSEMMIMCFCVCLLVERHACFSVRSNIYWCYLINSPDGKKKNSTTVAGGLKNGNKNRMDWFPPADSRPQAWGTVDPPRSYFLYASCHPVGLRQSDGTEGGDVASCGKWKWNYDSRDFFCSLMLNKKRLSLVNVSLCHRMFFLLIGLINAAIN